MSLTDLQRTLFHKVFHNINDPVAKQKALDEYKEGVKKLMQQRGSHPVCCPLCPAHW